MFNQKALSNALKTTVLEFYQGQRHVDFEKVTAYQDELLAILIRHLETSGCIVAELRAELKKLTYLHLSKVFDVADLPETPVAFLPLPDCAATIFARLGALAVAAFFQKTSVSYGSENDGGLFVNLVAMGDEGAFRKKSTKSMRGHTDAASFPFPGTHDPLSPRIAPSPDIVCLLGLRNPDSVSTTLMLLEDLLPDLMPGDIEQLSMPQFLIGCQRTFAAGTTKLLGVKHSVDNANILELRGDQHWVRYSHSSALVSPVSTNDPAQTTEMATAESLAAAAKQRFEEACVVRVRRVVIHPGDILWVDNRRALHGRSEVGKSIGGSSRWLIRGYALDPSSIKPDQYHAGSDFKLYP